LGQCTITIGINLNDKQEKMIDSIMEKLNGDFNFLHSDILKHIALNNFYYEFTDEKRKSYDDLIEPIYQSIIDFETSYI